MKSHLYSHILFNFEVFASVFSSLRSYVWHISVGRINVHMNVKNTCSGRVVTLTQKGHVFQEPFLIKSKRPNSIESTCQLADIIYFEHHYKFRTILYSLEPKNYTKLWMHGNWGRTETGDTTVVLMLGTARLIQSVRSAAASL